MGEIFDSCKNSWSEQQIICLVGDLAQCELKFVKEDEKANQDLVAVVLNEVTKRIHKPLKGLLLQTMDPVKKGLIAKAAGKFVRRLNKNKVHTLDKKRILDSLCASNMEWKRSKKR